MVNFVNAESDDLSRVDVRPFLLVYRTLASGKLSNQPCGENGLFCNSQIGLISKVISQDKSIASMRINNTLTYAAVSGIFGNYLILFVLCITRMTRVRVIAPRPYLSRFGFEQ